MIRRKYIREKVRELLSEFRIHEAPVDVIDLAERMGIDVRLTEAEDSLSGFLYRGEGTSTPVIGINSNHSSKRMRFTVAHELGHFVLHGSERVHYDDRSRGFQVHMRSDVSSEGVDRLEIEANAFAAELLMPVELLAKDLKELKSLDVVDSDPDFDRLVSKYDVSRRALAIRLAHLGYISELG